MSFDREGVMLPNVPPEVGELLLSTIRGNPDVPFATLAAGLILQAPDELKVEITNAVIEFATARATDRLAWLHTTGGSILVGTKVVPTVGVFRFGSIAWPIKALMSGPPKVVTVVTPAGRRPFYVACEGVDGAVVRASEAAALGMVIVEEFGGRLIEDREGEEGARKSMIEHTQHARVKARAEARAFAERATVLARAANTSRFARTPLIEALPGALNPGDILVPERCDRPRFKVETRVNDDWVMLVATQAGDVGPAGGWYHEDGREVLPGQHHAGWTEQEAQPEAVDQ